MLIHFIASRSNIEKDIEYFREINKTITDSGHKLTRDIVEPIYKLVTSGQYEQKAEEIDWKRLNEENTEAIAKADLVIAEVTTRSFSSGYQVALAIKEKRPTLILARSPRLKATYRSGLSSDFVKVVEYGDKSDLREIVTNFISENSIGPKDLRFNFFMDRRIYNHIRWVAYKTGKSKSEIIREALLKDIERDS